MFFKHRLLRVKRSKLIDHADIQQFASSQTSSVYDGGYNSRIDSLLKFERKVAVDPVKFRACVVTRQAKYMDYRFVPGDHSLQSFCIDLDYYHLCNDSTVSRMLKNF